MTTDELSARELVDQLDREAVVSGLDQWVALERDATAQIVAHLAVMERDRVHIEMEYTSLYSYCRQRLGYSRNAALKRIRAARVALIYPRVLDDLESGALTISGIAILARHLTGGEVGARLLELSRHRSCREIEALLATRFLGSESPRGDLQIKSIGDGLVRIEMVVGAELADKLNLARSLARQQRGTGDVEQVLSDALDRLIARGEANPQTPEHTGEHPETAGEVSQSTRQRRTRESRASALRFGLRSYKRSVKKPGTLLVAQRLQRRDIAQRDLTALLVGLGFSSFEARERARLAVETLGAGAGLGRLSRAAIEFPAHQNRAWW